MSSIILYNYFRSSTSYRVRIALNLKGLQFEYKPIHLLNNGGEQNHPEYRKINPIGGVPTLDHDGKVISQSMAIIEYLDEVFPKPLKLFPEDAFLRAKVRQFCENINADIHPLGNLKVLQYLEKEFHADNSQKEKWLSRWMLDGFTASQKIIEKTYGKYCFGNAITAADLFLVPQLFSARRFNVDLNSIPLLLEIEKNVLSHPAFEKAHPYRQIDTPADLVI